MIVTYLEGGTSTGEDWSGRIRRIDGITAVLMGRSCGKVGYWFVRNDGSPAQFIQNVTLMDVRETR